MATIGLEEKMMKICNPKFDLLAEKLLVLLGRYFIRVKVEFIFNHLIFLHSTIVVAKTTILFIALDQLPFSGCGFCFQI